MEETTGWGMGENHFIDLLYANEYYLISTGQQKISQKMFGYNNMKIKSIMYIYMYYTLANMQ